MFGPKTGYFDWPTYVTVALQLLCNALFVLSLCPFDISVGVGAFVIGLSHISSFFSQFESVNTKHGMGLTGNSLLI